MHVIVVGCGRVGSGLAVLLSKEGHSVAVLDKSPRAFRRLKDWDGPRIVGSGYDRDDLEKAGAVGADALAIVTEWREFRSPDFDQIKSALKTPVIFDGRNLYDPAYLAREGFSYYAIGRGKRSG